MVWYSNSVINLAGVLQLPRRCSAQAWDMLNMASPHLRPLVQHLSGLCTGGNGDWHGRELDLQSSRAPLPLIPAAVRMGQWCCWHSHAGQCIHLQLC